MRVFGPIRTRSVPSNSSSTRIPTHLSDEMACCCLGAKTNPEFSTFGPSPFCVT